MSGYGKHRFVNLSQSESDEFTCGICLEILNTPKVVPCCRQTYCSFCIDHWLNNKSCCPNDRHRLIRSQLYDPQRLVTNLMASLQIRCTFCETILDLQCLQSHEDQCLFNPNRRCSDCGLRIGEYPAQEDQQLSQHNCVNSLKSLNETLLEEMSELKSEIHRLREELKSLKDKNVFCNQSDHIHQVMASARTRISYPEITYCSIPSALRHKAINKSKEAILAFDSYLQISQFLNTEFNCDNCVDGNSGHKWYTIAHSVQCGESLIVNENGYIDLRFGQLRIAIFSAGAPLSATGFNTTSITVNSNHF